MNPFRTFIPQGSLCRGFLSLLALMLLGILTAQARPPLFLLDEDRLAEIQTLVTVPGTTHYEMFEAVKARVEANNIPGTGSYQRGYMAREAAFLYLLTGNTAYLDTAFTRLQEVFTVSQPAGEGTPSSGTGLARAQTIASFAMAYNWGYEGFTQAQRDWILERVNEGFDTYGTALGHPNIEYQQSNSNWNGVVAGAHVMSLIAMDQHMGERRRDFQRSREIVRVHPASFGNRGWTQEGNYYFGLSMEYVFPAMAALRQIGDPHAATTFATRRPHHIIMYASMFNAGQNSLTWGVGGDTIPNAGLTSALFDLIAPGEVPAFKWFFDRARGILNPAAPANKYDYHAGGTLYGLIFYPEDVTPADPSPSYPTVMDDNRGGYIFRSGWDGTDHSIVGLWGDTTNYGRSWSQADAGQISLMSYGVKWTAGPGPATSGLDNAFSQILVNGTARDTTGTGGLLGHQVSPSGGYARVNGGSKFAALGVDTAIRHVLTDFSPTDFDIISTFDELVASEAKIFAWNAFVPGRAFTTGSEDGVPYALLTHEGAYLKIWFVTPGAGFANGSNHITYQFDPAAQLDVWTVMATGLGTPPVAAITGSGNGATVILGDSELTFDGDTRRIHSSTLTDLNSPTNPVIGADTTTGLAPLTVAFSGSATADPGESLAYFWDFGDGHTSTAQNPAHTYTEDGIYMVILEVRDDAGGSDRTTRRVFVGDREPTARISVSESIVLPGVEITLDGSGSTDPEGDPLTYEWTLGDGRTLTGPVVTASWPTENVFTIELRVTDPAGNVNVARTSVRVENQPPRARFTADTLGGFVPFTVNFDASESWDPEGEPLVYEWNFRDGTPIVQTTEPFISHEFTTPGSFDVRLTVYDPAGKSDNRTETVTALGPETIIGSTPDTGTIAQGLNYRVFVGDPSADAGLPNIDILRPLGSGRVSNLDFHVAERDVLYAIRYEGYLHVPETGAYAFRLRVQHGSRLTISGETIIATRAPHTQEYLELVALEAGYHPFRFETTYNPENAFERWNFNDLTWAPPGTDQFRPIPDSLFFSNINLLEPAFRATPQMVYDGGTVQFEATTLSPDGEPLHFAWDFGDGNTATGRSVAHTYNLPSNLAHRVYSAVLTITDSTGASQTVGDLITVSRYANLVMREHTSIGATSNNFDRRTAPRNLLEAVNHALEPGTQLYFSSQLRADLGAAMTADGAYQTRWVSSNPVDYLWFHFQKDGVDKPYIITEYSLTSGGLAWTADRDPRNWRIYGSNAPEPFDLEPGAANPAWTLIDSVTDQAGYARIMPTVYSLPNTQAFAHYLFRLENQSGGIAGSVELTELQLFSYLDKQTDVFGNQPPVADLHVSAETGEAPLTVHFDASGTTDPDNDWLYYTWDFGDGHVHSLLLGEDTFTHTYYQPGTYHAVLTVRDGNGASDTVTRTIIVDPPTANEVPVPAISVSVTTVLVGTRLDFDASGSFDPDGDAMDFSWEFGDGRRAQGETVSHTFDKPGTFDVVLIARDERGLSASTFQTIEVLPPNGGRGILSFNFNERRRHMSYTIGAGLMPVAYWNNLLDRGFASIPIFPGWFDSNGNPIDLTVTSELAQELVAVSNDLDVWMDGNARLTQRARTQRSYGAPVGVRWIVEGVPYSTYNVYVYYAGAENANPAAFEVNGERRYAGRQGYTYDGSWSVSEATAPGEVVDGDNVVLWRNLSGSTMELEVISASNRPAIYGFQIVDRTGAADAPPLVAILSPADGDTVITGDAVTFSGSALQGGQPLDDAFLSWSSNIDGLFGSGATVATSSLSMGVHTITFTATNDSDLATSESRTLTVLPTPQAPVVLEQPVDRLVFESTHVELSALVIGNPAIDGYQWFRDGEPVADGPRISGAQSPQLVIHETVLTDGGSYTLAATNALGTTFTDPAVLTVEEVPDLSILLDVGDNGPGPVAGFWNTIGAGSAFGPFINSINGQVTSDVEIDIINTSGAGLQPSGNTEAWGTRTFAPEWADLNALNDRMWVNRGDTATIRFRNLVPSRTYDIEIASSFAGSGSTGSAPGIFEMIGETGPALGFNALTAEELGTQVHWTSRSPNDGGGSGAAEGWLIWPAVQPNADGEILLYLSTTTNNNSRVSINAMRLVESRGDALESAPVFTEQPTGLIALIGTTAEFSATAAASPPVEAYRWLRNGVMLFDNDRISGADTPHLTITALEPADSGNYVLEATNPVGTSTSAPAALEVIDPPSDATIMALFDFGAALPNPVGNWNTIGVGSEFTDLVDFLTGKPIPGLLLEVSGSLQNSTGSTAWGTRTVSPPWADANALNDRLFVSSAATLTLRNLNPARTYTIEIASSWDSPRNGARYGILEVRGADGLVTGFNAHTGDALGTSVFWTTIGPNDGGEDAYSVEGWMIWEGVQPDESGTVVIDLKTSNQSISRVSMNAMRLVEEAEDDEGPAPGTRAAWRLAHFGDTADEGDAADLANPTGDGLPNLLKFALDLDPTVPAGGADRTVVDMVDVDGARVLKLRIPADLNRPELHYVLEMSEDLATWGPLAEAVGHTTFTATPGAPVSSVVREGGMVNLSLTSEAPTRAFYRLTITLVE
jgi:PKD repeat protein